MAKVGRQVCLLVSALLALHTVPSVEGSLSEKPHLPTTAAQEDRAFNEAHTPHRTFPEVAKFVRWSILEVRASSTMVTLHGARGNE